MGGSLGPIHCPEPAPTTAPSPAWGSGHAQSLSQHLSRDNSAFYPGITGKWKFPPGFPRNQVTVETSIYSSISAMCCPSALLMLRLIRNKCHVSAT